MFFRKSLIIATAGLAIAASAEQKEQKKKEAIKDPFQFSFQQNNKKGGFIPSSTQSVPTGVKVVAIIDMGKKGIMAALRTGDNDTPYYVKKGDIIRVNRKVQMKDKKGTQTESVYLEVVNLTKSEVTIAPKQRPDAKVILR